MLVFRKSNRVEDDVDENVRGACGASAGRPTWSVTSGLDKQIYLGIETIRISLGTSLYVLRKTTGKTLTLFSNYNMHFVIEKA